MATKKDNAYPRLEIRPLTDLCTHPDHDRTSSSESKHWLRRSVEKFGLLQLPVLNARTGRLLGGALLVSAMRDMERAATPTWVVDLAPELEEAAALALNNHAGEWIWKEVSLVLKKMNENNEPLGLTGFHDSDIGPLVAADWKPAEKGPLDGSDARQGALL